MDKLDQWMKREVGTEEKKSSNVNNSIKATSQNKTPFFKRKMKPSAGQNQPRPQVQPQARPQPAHQAQAKAQTQGQHRPQSQPQVRPQAQAQNKPQPQSQPQARPQAQQRPPQKQNTNSQKPKNNTKRPHNNRPNQQKVHKPLPKMDLNRKAIKAEILKGKLKIIPFGGLNEVGKNMMALEYENDIMIIDMGFEFPGEDMLGIDYVIPDVTYLEDNKDRIRGVVITHGHLDHIGGIPYVLPKLGFPPVYGTKLTIGLISKKIVEFKLEKMTKLFNIDPDKPLKLGVFLCNFFRVNHSIPDAVGVVVDTPAGKIVHTGDFKFDENPAGNQKRADIHKLKALGHQNVLALFSDSTNALKPGHTMSEEQVGKTIEEIIKKETGRLIIASFSSLIGRIQQILNYAKKYNRKVFVSGRSMNDNINIASKLGYLNIPKGLVQDIRKYKDVPDNETLILTTGSQGESVSALTRIANNDHQHIKVKKGDKIILSSSPIIGNERAIASVINNLCMLGAQVIHNQIMDVHTSGHARQEELKMMIRMVQPKYFVPIHGEYFMRQGHAVLATEQCGIPEERTIMMKNGEILIAADGIVTKSKETVETKYILIDGSGEGRPDSQVLVEREIMSQNGALIVVINVSKKTKKIMGDPGIVSRGFMYMHESEEIAKEISKVAEEAYRKIQSKNPNAPRKDIKKYVLQSVDKLTRDKLERRPLIIPLIVEM